MMLRTLLSKLGSRSHSTPSRIFGIVGFVLIHLGLSSLERVAAADFDPVVYDRAETFTYLDRMREMVGDETYISVATRDLIAAAEMIGGHGRRVIAAETLIEHVKKAAAIRDTAPYKNQVPRFLWERYGLPIRLRNERFRNAGWLVPVAERMEEIAGKETTIRGRADKVFNWIDSNISTEPELLDYGMRGRGDLDPLTVLRGGYGGTSDIALTTVGSLRSVGVLARLVYCPNNLESGGELVWVEFWNDESEWIAWVPGWSGIPTEAHRAELERLYSRQLPVVLADPFAKEDVTRQYFKVFDFGKPVRTGTRGHVAGSFSVMSAGILEPVAGIEFDWIRGAKIPQKLGIRSAFFSEGSLGGGIKIHQIKTEGEEVKPREND